MTTIPANPVLIDALDAFYSFVAANMAKLNPDQKMLGMIAAQDWPQLELDTNGGLNLLYLSSVPIGGTQSQNYYQHFVQWVWVLMGDDISKTQVGLNRGSRYRSHFAIAELLRQAHFPGFCPKQFSTVDSTTGDVTFTTYDPIETITWSMPKIVTRNDNPQSGLLYGTASLRVSSYSDVNPVVNP